MLSQTPFQLFPFSWGRISPQILVFWKSMWLRLMGSLQCNLVVLPLPLSPPSHEWSLHISLSGGEVSNVVPVALPLLPVFSMYPTLYRTIPSLWRQPVLPLLIDGLNLPQETFWKIWVLLWVQGGTWHLFPVLVLIPQ